MDLAQSLSNANGNRAQLCFVHVDHHPWMINPLGFLLATAAALVSFLGGNIHDSWDSLRDILTVQRRVTTSMQRSDGRSIHIRKSTKAEPALMRIYQALCINAAPGGTKKLLV